MAVGDSIQVTEGSGKRMATGATYTENAQTVRDEKVILGEPYLAAYVLNSGVIAVSTTAAHTFQIMAGASLKVRILGIRVEQDGLASAASILRLQGFRLTSAGTGGTAFTPAPLDPGDSAAGATGMTQPSAKGTEGTRLFDAIVPLVSAWPNVAPAWEQWFTPDKGLKPIVIPAGTANGFVLKVNAGITTNPSVTMSYWFTETPF